MLFDRGRFIKKRPVIMVSSSSAECPYMELPMESDYRPQPERRLNLSAFPQIIFKLTQL